MTDTQEQPTQDLEQEVAEQPKLIKIEVQNPDAEEMAAIVANINTNFNFDVNVKSVNYNFKKSKDKDTGIETLRSSVQLAMPYPSVAGIVAILEGGEPGNNKGLDLLLEAMESVVNAQARDILYEDTTLTAATFPVDRCSWEHIATIPKVTRRGGGIPKEVWEAFGQDYVEVMPEVTGKKVEQVANAAKILTNKLAAVKTNQAVLELLVGQITIYAEHSPNVAEYQDCLEFLLAKAETFLNVTDEELLSAL